MGRPIGIERVVHVERAKLGPPAPSISQPCDVLLRGESMTLKETRTVIASDGIKLNVQGVRHESDDAPTVLLVHGFPDDHSVWDGVAAELESDFHVVTYDARGAGRSSRPRAIKAYRLDQLADDIGRVIDEVSPNGAVHLVGHDWGSVQAWHATTDPEHRYRIASLTSISGPCLDHVPLWIRARLRSGPRGWRDVLGLWKSPLYMGFFQLPWIAPLACRIGIVDRTIALAEHFETGQRPRGASAHRARDNRSSLKIYTANLLPRLLRPQRRSTTVPVQVLAPRRDVFITPASQVDVSRWAPDLTVHSIDGGHWAPAFHPEAVASLIRTFVERRDPASTTEGAAQ